MLIRPRTVSNFISPKIYIGSNEVKYVDQYKYLGHIVSSSFTDDYDIERETRNLYIRGITIARKFYFLSTDVKCALFKSYCYPLYHVPCGRDTEPER